MTESFQIHIDEAKDMIASVAEERMNESVNEVRTHTLEKLSGSRSGRQYRIPGTSRYYTASAPGEPPAQRLGELRQHVSSDVSYENKNLIGRVGMPESARSIEGANLGDIAEMLEKGTVKMAPRPWLEPSFREEEDKVKSIFGRPWEK